jgi:hypothetical protein
MNMIAEVREEAAAQHAVAQSAAMALPQSLQLAPIKAK